MKLVYSFLLSICFFTSLFSQDVFFREQTEKPMPFILEFDDAEIADADNQISPQALSEEDITVILFNELDFPSNDAQEETTPEIIIISAKSINTLEVADRALIRSLPPPPSMVSLPSPPL